MATELPKISFKNSDKEYYYDARLNEIRNVKDFTDSYNLTRDESESIEYFLSVGKNKQPYKVTDLESAQMREMG